MKRQEWYILLFSVAVFLALYFWLRKKWLSDTVISYGDYGQPDLGVINY